jgi:uncharacterized membrane protein
MPALTGLSIVVGIVVIVILVVSVAAWWVAAIAGLGVICLASLIDLALQSNRANAGSGEYSGYHG